MRRKVYLRPILEDDPALRGHWENDFWDYEAGTYPGGPNAFRGVGGVGVVPLHFEAIIREFSSKSITRRVVRCDAIGSVFDDQAVNIETLMAQITTPRTLPSIADMSMPQVMGILNVTPDSFSDGGAFEHVIGDRVRALVSEGATIIDIGGESTRPDADDVALDEEWARVAPALEAASEADVLVSIDTRKAEIARRALKAGARLFNDVSALTYDPDSLGVARMYAEAGGSICLMHASGDPKTMQSKLAYDDVVLDIYDYLESRVRACEDVGISRQNLIVDPGIGFGKTVEHNLTLLRNLSLFHSLGCSVLLGASRKGFIGTLSGEKDATQRGPGSIAVALQGARQGMNVLRVHDVRETVQALAVDAAIRAA